MLKEQLGVETVLVSGAAGEFTIRVDDRIVSGKRWWKWPSDETIVKAVRQALGR